MRKLAPLFLAAGLSLPAALPAQDKPDKPAGPTGTYLKAAMLTEDKYSQEEKTVFFSDSPSINAVYRIVVVSPAKLRAVFWADAVEGVDPKTKLLEKTVALSEKGEFMGAIPALKPPNGWPSGAYHVDVYVGESLAKALPFKVVKR